MEWYSKMAIGDKRLRSQEVAPGKRMSQSKKQSETYFITDLAAEFGVSLRTLRFYEDRGLLSPRRDGVNRMYDARERSKLSVILKGKQLGFTLSEISGMLKEERGVSSPDLKMSLEQVDDQISYLKNQKAEVEQALRELRKYRQSLV